MRFERIVRKYDNWPVWGQNVVKALATIIPVYFSALLGVWIDKISGKTIIVHGIIIVIVLTLLLWLYYTLKMTRDNLHALGKRRNRALLQAYSYINRYVMDNLIAFNKGL